MSQKNNSSSLLRQSTSLSLHYNASLYYYYSLTTKEKSLRLIYKSKKTIQKTLERNHVKKKSISSYVIGYRNSSKKLESLDQSGILLCHKRL